MNAPETAAVRSSPLQLEIENKDSEPSDAALAALAKLLVDDAMREESTEQKTDDRSSSATVIGYTKKALVEDAR